MNSSRQAALLCLPALLAGLAACGSKADRVHRACMNQVEAGIAELRRESGGQSEAIARPLLEMSRAAGSAGCEAIREACRNEPEGIVCRSAAEELLSE